MVFLSNVSHNPNMVYFNPNIVSCNPIMVSFNPNMTPCNPNMVCVIQIWFCSDQNVCCPMHQKKILNSSINSILLYIVPCYNFSSGSGTQNFWMGPSSWSRSFTHCKRTDLIQSAAFKHPLPLPTQYVRKLLRIYRLHITQYTVII